MRSFIVERAHKSIKAGLLLKAVRAWGAGCHFLKGEVHALMAAVLLGMARPDALDFDAQAQPPDGEL